MEPKIIHVDILGRLGRTFSTYARERENRGDIKNIEGSKIGVPNVPTPSSGKNGPAYFKAEYLQLVDFLNQQWPLLPQERKNRIFRLIDDLDRHWLAEDRENFGRVVEEIREAAVTIPDLKDDPIPEVVPLFQTPTEGGDPA